MEFTRFFASLDIVLFFELDDFPSPELLEVFVEYVAIIRLGGDIYTTINKISCFICEGVKNRTTA